MKLRDKRVAHRGVTPTGRRSAVPDGTLDSWGRPGGPFVYSSSDGSSSGSSSDDSFESFLAFASRSMIEIQACSSKCLATGKSSRPKLLTELNAPFTKTFFLMDTLYSGTG